MLSPPAKAFAALAAAASAIAASILLSSCYVGSEGTRYLSLLSKAVSLDRALADPKTKSEARQLIERAQAARAFAVSELGLKDTRNYKTIVEIDSDRIATVVQACAELSFDRYLWSYPVVGKLPYRGYFDARDAAAEAARLKKLGLDTIARPVDAFSTLGFLSDPLFSFMASYDEADVADLVIHEMTHATIFLRGGGEASQFNEELATFVGRRGSLLYLGRKYGPDSPQVAAAMAARGESAAFVSYLALTAKELEAVYSSGASEAEKRARKAEIIAARAEEYKKESGVLFKGEGYRNFDMGRINNAYLDLYRLYEGDSPLYGDFCDKVCGGDLRTSVQKVSRIASDRKTKSAPKAEMRRLVEEASR